MAEEIENSQNFTAEQRSSVKVVRNTKGYNWEIKVYNDNPDKALDKMIELELICQARYGEKIE